MIKSKYEAELSLGEIELEKLKKVIKMTIELSEEQAKQLKNGEDIIIKSPKNKDKWYPKYRDIYLQDELYKIKNQIALADKIMRKHNRLLSWVMENDDGWVADWSDPSQDKHFIEFIQGKYYVSNSCQTQTLGSIYMSMENAMKLAKLLNNGIVKL